MIGWCDNACSILLDSMCFRLYMLAQLQVLRGITASIIAKMQKGLELAKTARSALARS